jgi:enediyne biosynthesis protein E4
MIGHLPTLAASTQLAAETAQCGCTPPSLRVRAQPFLLLGLVSALLASPAFAETDRALWQQQGPHRYLDVTTDTMTPAGFTLLNSERTGISFSNYLSEFSAARNRILSNGSGVAAGDIDGDGWVDLYFCRLEGPNVLYRNLGNFQFEDITEQAGVACPGQYSTGAAFADLNGNGHLDLLVNSIGGGTRAFLNDGHGRFSELTDSGLLRQYGSTSLALADIDGDGYLDLYVANYRTTNFKDNPPGLKIEARRVGDRIVVTPEDRFLPLTVRETGVEVVERGEADILYRNRGDGRFGRISWTQGAFLDEQGRPLSAAPTDWVLSAMFRDVNRDLAPDLYVCADFFWWPDRFWLNDDSRRFQAISHTAVRNMSVSAMAVDFGDINRDGHDDFITVDMVSRSHAWRHRQRPDMMSGIVTQNVADPMFRPEVVRNTLFLNRGDTTFAEIAQLSGVQWSEWSWSVILLDVDLDGYEDILITTGNHHDVQDADVLTELARIRAPPNPAQQLHNLRQFPPLLTPNLAFRNQGDLTFEEATDTWGFGLVGVSHGMALADLDNDGDLDVIINNLNAPAGIFRNNTSAPRLGIRLRGSPPNTRGVGARIQVDGGPVPQSQEMICGGRYLSSDDFMRTFAAGEEEADLTIHVTWRNGQQTILTDVRPNRIYEISQLDADPAPPAHAQPAVAPAWFEDVSSFLAHRHVDPPFDDFQYQPLLHRRLSAAGPAIAWIDLDSDGWDDLVIGAGPSSPPALLRNNHAGGFDRFPSDKLILTPARGQTGIVGWHPTPTNTVIFFGLSNWEDGRATGPGVVAYRTDTQALDTLFPADASSPGPLALGDLDGDGKLDLFVGGRSIPWRYPRASHSLLLKERHGQFEVQSEWSEALRSVGLVNAALFSDLDGDGRPELILACEWGPIRIFQFVQGTLREVTEAWGLAAYTGWWNSVATGDFTGDGRLDLVAGNWGRNSKYQAVLEHPIRLYHGDIEGNGVFDLFEVYLDPDSQQWVPWREWRTMTAALPFLADAFPTHAAYGQASIHQLLGSRISTLLQLEASTLDSMLFLNRGNHFEATPLPLKAQFAPVFGLAIGDFDGDGHEDLFLAQNFFAVDPETSRYDGGRGLLLHGAGQGRFNPVPGHITGIQIYGEQRGAALADFDQDGRVDLVVTQRNQPTRLYRNTHAKPGLRVRLDGGPTNPTGIGASMRLGFGSHWGPAREVQAGSGYWSQNSPIQVLGTPGAPREIQILWPGGSVTRSPLPDDTANILVRLDGQIHRLP